MRQEFEYKMHDIVNVPHKQSIAVVGKLTNDEVNILSVMDNNVDQFSFESEVTSYDEKNALKFNFNIDACLTDDDFVLLDFSFGRNDEKFKNFVTSKYPEIYNTPLANEQISTMYCNVFFAHMHDDSSVVSSRGQLMFVIENKIGHKLISIDGEGIEHVITPEAGDIIFLDIKCLHSVVPNQELGIDSMRQNGLIFASINYS